ncbi:MAG: hypothetical protein ACRCV5_09335 [Afipia sp.]
MMATQVGLMRNDQMFLWMVEDDTLPNTRAQPFMVGLRERYEYHIALSEWLQKLS